MSGGPFELVDDVGALGTSGTERSDEIGWSQGTRVWKRDSHLAGVYLRECLLEWVLPKLAISEVA